MAKPLATALESATARVERASVLDAPAEIVARIWTRVLADDRVKELASGADIGHPLHPALVALPIGSWTAASVLDLTGGDARAARRLIALGNLSALPAAITGAHDWLSTSGAERRVGLVHATLNYAALVLYLGSGRARRRGRRDKGAVLALAGASVAAAAGWLGGHLAYALGVGVDTTAFQHFPQDWTDVATDADVLDARPLLVDAAGVPVVLIRVGGRVVALADRCTHRGGPLHDGTVADGCLTCPWHGSRFLLADGSVEHGPASRPQPRGEVRVVDGRVQVRRADEPRTLRTRPVGH